MATTDEWRPKAQGPTRDAIWQPQPKQAIFMSRPEPEALYGGAAGGGKSDALVIEALRQVHIPHYKCLIVRKTFPQLRELIDKTLVYYPQAYPKARYNSSSHTWTFPSGAKIIFGSLPHAASRFHFQGLSFDAVFFDELTHFSQEEYLYLMSRNRPNGPGTRVYMRATANPGGVGHGWVKERFITAGAPMQRIWEHFQYYDTKGVEHKGRRSRIFVPSTVFDNQSLMRYDPGYVEKLAMLPDAEKKALLYGDWDSFSGQVFTEWKNDPSHYKDQRWTHVIEPFRIPPDWKIWCGLDWGYTRPFSVGWYAIDRDQRMYRIRELYGCTGTPNVGVQWTPVQLAQKIKEIEKEDPNLKGRLIRRVGDPAIWGSDGMESIGSVMAREGVRFERADHERVSGKMQLHNRLAFNEEGIPMLYIFSTSKHFIRTIPNLVYDETNVEDIDTDLEDHIYDECRYVCMAHPYTPPLRMQETGIVYPGPLDSINQPGTKQFDWYRKY